MRIILALLMVALTGCIPGISDIPGFPGSATPVPTAAPAPPDAPLASLTVVGGIAYTVDTWIIQMDGTVIHTSGIADKKKTETLQLSNGAAGAEKLRQQLLATGITKRPSGRYAPINTCCDRREHTLTLALNGNLYEYYTLDGAEAPNEIGQCESLVRQAANSAH